MAIKHWAEDDKPREKLIEKGAEVLSNSELLAILFSTGIHTATTCLSAIDLAKSVLELTENNVTQLGKLTLADLCRVKGIGKAKAVTLLAALELGRRRMSEQETLEKNIIFNCSRKIFDLFIPLLSDKVHEEIWILLLNSSKKIIAKEKLSSGGSEKVGVDIKILAKKAVNSVAHSVALIHNHPSGNVFPSNSDKMFTQKVKQALALLDIILIDHIIIGGKEYYSFCDEKIL